MRRPDFVKQTALTGRNILCACHGRQTTVVFVAKFLVCQSRFGRVRIWIGAVMALLRASYDSDAFKKIASSGSKATGGSGLIMR
jgi:hypothetical protein